MDAEKLIAALKAKNVNLYRIGDRLKWRAPKGALPPEDLAKLKQHKAEVLKLVESREPIEIPKGSRTGNLVRGDCLRVLELMPADSVDLVVTDPPYGYSFMGKDWDKAVPSVEIWKECLRVLKAGAFAYIMSAPRQDVLTRMIANLERAGFNTGFTSLYWTYASGFPKAHNISKAIDKKAGSEPKGVFIGAYGGYQPKPAVEVILVVQKPLSEKTYADQALVNGKGVSWLGDCRIPYQGEAVWSAEGGVQWSPERKWKNTANRSGDQAGRFPANLLVSDDVLDDGRYAEGKGGVTKCQAGTGAGLIGQYDGRKTMPKIREGLETVRCIHDSGTYSRYFSLDTWAAQNLPFLIVPKASMREKNAGLEAIDSRCLGEKGNGLNRICEKCGAPQLKPCDCEPKSWVQPKRRNHHPTVKPIQLMAYLITMGSREGDVVLDPFCGSGTTCLAAFNLKRRSFGIELNPGYFEIASEKYRTLVLESYRNKK